MRKSILAALCVAIASVGYISTAASTSAEVTPQPPAPTPAAESATNAPAPKTASDETRVYLRCFYRSNVSDGSVRTDYKLAKGIGKNKYLLVPGYWFDRSAFARNMFYTDASQSKLARECATTLSNGGGEPFYASANEDIARSLNYTIWTNDQGDQGNAVNKLISFGDSLSDTGTLYNSTNWQIPNPTSWYLGRFSNGPVWVEWLARDLHLPVYSWAVGGAWTGGQGPIPSLVEQIQSWQRYMLLAKNYRIRNTQFLIWMGANDITGGSSAPSIVADIERGLTSLLDAGATRILILNLPDISQAPAYRGGKDAPRIAKEVQDYNRLLAQTVERLQDKYGADRQILIYDANSMFTRLLSNPGSFGMANATDSCLDISSNSTYTAHFDVRKSCIDGRLQWVFWDLVHPTTAVHTIISTQVFQLLWSLWHHGAAAPPPG